MGFGVFKKRCFLLQAFFVTERVGALGGFPSLENPKEGSVEVVLSAQTKEVQETRVAIFGRS